MIGYGFTKEMDNLELQKVAEAVETQLKKAFDAINRGGPEDENIS